MGNTFSALWCRLFYWEDDLEALTTDDQAKETSQKIDMSIKKDIWLGHNAVKLLLLGMAESGKSTLARQLTITKGGGYTVEERQAFKPKIFENAITSLAKVLSAMSTHSIQFADSKRYFEGMNLKERIVYNMSNYIICGQYF